MQFDVNLYQLDYYFSQEHHVYNTLYQRNKNLCSIYKEIPVDCELVGPVTQTGRGRTPSRHPAENSRSPLAWGPR